LLRHGGFSCAGGGHGKKVLTLSYPILAFGLILLAWAPESTGAAEETLLNIHRKIAACNSDFGSTFPVNPDDPEDPTDCTGVCMTCHPDGAGAGGIITGQEFNPTGMWTNDPDAYGEETAATGTSGGDDAGTAGADTDARWTDLPPQHSRCRDCHTDYASDASNHPIFVSMEAAFAEGGLILFDGTILCATCHDPHDGETAGLLRVANTRSALCLTCHNI
jgi:predicted CXXCH cytochrome family protein